MGQSNNFDGPVIIDELDQKQLVNTYGFGRTGFNDFADGPVIGVTVDDPSTSLIPANVGSLALRYAPGFVQLWQKTSAPDAGWTQVGSGGGSSSTQYSYVWDPLEPTPSGNVYASFAALYAAASLVPGEKLVEVVAQAAIVDATFEAGTYDLSEFVFRKASYIDQSNMVIPNGVSFTALPKQIWGLTLASTQTVGNAAFEIIAASDVSQMTLFDQSHLVCSGTKPLVLISAANVQLFITLNDLSSISLNATQVIVNNNAASVVGVGVFNGSEIEGNTINGVAGSTLQYATAGANKIAAQVGFIGAPDAQNGKFSFVEHQAQVSIVDITLTQFESAAFLDTSGANHTVNLPPAALMAGREILCQKTSSDGNQLIVDPSGAELINGAATANTTTAYGSITAVCNGTAWFVKSRV